MESDSLDIFMGQPRAWSAGDSCIPRKDHLSDILQLVRSMDTRLQSIETKVEIILRKLESAEKRLVCVTEGMQTFLS